VCLAIARQLFAVLRQAWLGRQERITAAVSRPPYPDAVTIARMSREAATRYRAKAAMLGYAGRDRGANRSSAMRCMLCDAEMILIKTVQDDTMPVPGFERRTFRCPACQDVERHLAFVKPGQEGDSEPMPVPSAPPSSEGQIDNDPLLLVHAAPSTAPASERLDERPAARGLFRRVVARVVTTTFSRL
jgi:hypothetical protein